jgi:hypothetical protein
MGQSGGQQRADRVIGSVVEQNSVVGGREVPVGFAAQQQHRHRVDQHLSGDLIGHGVWYLQHGASVGEDPLRPGARVGKHADSHAFS